MADDDKVKIIEHLEKQKQQNEDLIKWFEEEDAKRSELLEAQENEINALKRDNEKKGDEFKKLKEHLQKTEEEAEEMRKLAQNAFVAGRNAAKKCFEEEDAKRNELLEAQENEIKALKRDNEKKAGMCEQLQKQLQKAEEEAEEIRKLAQNAFVAIGRMPKKEDEFKKLKEHLQKAEEEAEEMRKLAQNAFAAVRRVPKKAVDRWSVVGTSSSAQSSRRSSIVSLVPQQRSPEPQKPAFNPGHLLPEWFRHTCDDVCRMRDSGAFDTTTTGEAGELEQYSNNGLVEELEQYSNDKSGKEELE